MRSLKIYSKGTRTQRGRVAGAYRPLQAIEVGVLADRVHDMLRAGRQVLKKDCIFSIVIHI